MRRQNFTRAGVVDAAIQLQILFGPARAIKLLEHEGLSPEVVARVLGEDMTIVRSQPSTPFRSRCSQL
jgi:hypothetical protein